jgi:hypothetical protein
MQVLPFFRRCSSLTEKVQEILEILRSQILSPIEATSLASIRQLGNKMENILLAALDSYNNTFVEIRVVLGARFGHRLCKSQLEITTAFFQL